MIEYAVLIYNHNTSCNNNNNCYYLSVWIVRIHCPVSPCIHAFNKWLVSLPTLIRAHWLQVNSHAKSTHTIDSAHDKNIFDVCTKSCAWKISFDKLLAIVVRLADRLTIYFLSTHSLHPHPSMCFHFFHCPLSTAAVDHNTQGSHFSCKLNNMHTK